MFTPIPSSLSFLELHVEDYTDIPVAVFFFPLLPKAHPSGGMIEASKHLEFKRGLNGQSRRKTYTCSMHYALTFSFKAISGFLGTKVHISQICSYIQLIASLPWPSTKLLNCFHNISSLQHTATGQNNLYLGFHWPTLGLKAQSFVPTTPCAHTTQFHRLFRLQWLKSTITCFAHTTVTSVAQNT